MIRGILKKSAFLAYCLVAAVVFVELGARFVFRDMPEGLFGHRPYLVPSASSEAIYEYRPGMRFKGGLYVTNSHGMRGPEVSRVKPEGVFRIAAVGDSYTFGHGVPEDETWIRRLEARLDSATPSLRVEILNFGVQGYTSRNELGLLESKVLGFDPDMVLLSHLVNDNSPDFARVVRDQVVFYYELDPDVLIPLPSRLKEVFYRYSLCYRYFAVGYLNRHRKETALLQNEAAEKHQEEGPSDENLMAPGGIDRASLARMAELCVERGIAFFLLDFQVTPGGVVKTKAEHERQISRGLQSLARQAGVGYIDMFPVLRGKNAKRMRVAEHDAHPNGELCALYARHLERRLSRFMSRVSRQELSHAGDENRIRGSSN